MTRAYRYFCLYFVAALWAPAVFAQVDSTRVPEASSAVCSEDPVEDALVSTCVPASIQTAREEQPVEKVSLPPATIHLSLPSGTPLRIALDQRARINHPGEVVHGKLVEAVYSFDQPVIPAGTVATGHVTSVEQVSAVKRMLAYSNGNFTPFHKYKVTFDTLTLPDGKQLPIDTSVSAGTAEVVHLVSNPDKQKQKSLADRGKEQAKGKIAEAKEEVHSAWEEVKAPGKLHRLKQLLVAQSPYRRQYLDPGTRFVADLNAPLDFGETTRTGEQLTQVGSTPAPDSTLKARLVEEVSSATATRGTSVTAILTEPLYSPNHELILPANTRLVGEVLQAKPAQKLHHNGELRVIFERIETPEETAKLLAEVRAPSPELSSPQPHLQRLPVESQTMVGSLEGLEVDRKSNIKLDEEGGAHTTDSKTRYLSTGLTLLVAAAAAHPDAERGAVDSGGDPSVRTAAGGSGFRLVGAAVSLAAKSTPISIALSAYGASQSIYSNFLSRGSDVVLPKDTPLEISFGAPHTAPKTP
jgi:hypothetical protein